MDLSHTHINRHNTHIQTHTDIHTNKWDVLQKHNINAWKHTESINISLYISYIYGHRNMPLTALWYVVWVV